MNDENKLDSSEGELILCVEDGATLAAIDRGVKAADEGRVSPWTKSDGGSQGARAVLDPLSSDDTLVTGWWDASLTLANATGRW